MNSPIILSLFTLLFALALNFIDTGASDENPEGQEYCNRFTNSVIGLKPYMDSSEDKIKQCKKFWRCRVKDAGNTKTVEPRLYSCADADPTKPFYHAETCECIDSSNHCKEQHTLANIFTCTRQVDEVSLQLENLEDCRGFGPNGKYYLENFVHFDDPTKFWKCSDWFNNTTYADRPMSCPGNLIWDSSFCICNHTTENDAAIHQANVHPMNRFRCTKEFVPGAHEICKDANGIYYAGLFPSTIIMDRNNYWECVANTTTNPKIAEPIKRNCDKGLLFDVVGCNCTSPENFDEKQNQDPQNHYNCAKILEADPDPETELCKDRYGVYHIGDIPNVQDCSKFYSCTENNDEIVRAIPKPRECPPNQNFNVRSCQCWRPAEFDCKVNEDPDNTFICANKTLPVY